MGENEIEFRKQIKVNDKSSIPDTRSAQQRAIDELHKMTPRDLETIMNPSDISDSNIQKWARRVWSHETPTVSKEEQGSYECDRDVE